VLTVGSLFAGIGGIDLGLERAGMQIRWQVEIDDYCNRILAKHWPNTPRFGDVRKLSGDELEPVDLIAGGFPCQDVSIAARYSEGFTGERTGLFWEFARIIRTIRPKYIFLENVPGLINNGLSEVLGELATIGYNAEWEIIQSNWFGFPHVRKRLFIIAHSMRFGRGIFDSIYYCSPEDAKQRLQDQNFLLIRGDGDSESILASGVREDNGLPNGLDRDRIRTLGNAVVPQVAEYIGRLIIEFDEKMKIESGE